MSSNRRIASFKLCLLIAFTGLIGACGDQSPPSSVSVDASTATQTVRQQTAGVASIEELRSKADKGDADAMYQLSRKYSAGNGVERDEARSSFYLEKAADLNHLQAVYWLAQQSAWKIDVNSHLIEGLSSRDKVKNAITHYSKAVLLYTKAVELGHKEAEAELATTILYGVDNFSRNVGVPLRDLPMEFRGNVSNAISYFEKAAANENISAMVAMFWIHNEKEWGHQNLPVAQEWLKKLEAVADAEKIDRIGRQLFYGEYANPKPNFFDQFDDNWKPKQSALSASMPFIQRAARLGNTDSQERLSRILLGGFNGYRSPSEAATWLQKASDAGSAWAQVTLGRLYMAGDGVLQDFSAAVVLFEKAASALPKVTVADDGSSWTTVEPKVWEAQYLLGVLNEKGLGVSKNLVAAHAWYNIAATNGFDKAVSARKALTPQLTADQLAEAQGLAKNWTPGVNSVTSIPIKKSITQSESTQVAVKVATGTVFVVSKAGHAITNQHVVGGCSELRVQGHDGLAKLLHEDKVNDLALIKLKGEISDVAPIVAEPGKLRQGEEIVVFGFPLNSVLSSGGNLTPGVVSALTGLGNNSNQIQITAPIQPGSSGSPVMNKKGEVIGVVAMKLDDGKMANATGQIGQTVNFAVSGQTLRTFLDTHKVSYSTRSGIFSREKNPADLADEARKWTLVVECWK